MNHLSKGSGGGDRSTCRRSSKEADALPARIASSFVTTPAIAEAAGEASRVPGAVRLSTRRRD